MGNEDQYETRLSALERWRTTIEVSLGKHEVDKEYINKRFDTLESELKEIKETARKLFWTITSAVILYAVTFVLNGGLTTFKAGVQ